MWWIFGQLGGIKKATATDCGTKNDDGWGLLETLDDQFVGVL